jgi:hypothetical protein
MDRRHGVCVPNMGVLEFVIRLATGAGLCAVGLMPVRADQPGLLGVHFHEPDFTRPARVEAAARLDWDTGTEHGGYARVWLGRLRVPVDGEITLEAEADDGLVLMLAGREVIDGWHGSQRTGRLAGREGAQLPLEVRYYQSGGTAHCRLYWSWPGKPRELIPADAFSHDEADVSRAEALVAGREKPAVPEVVRTLRPPAPPTVTAWAPGDWLLLDERNVHAVDQASRVVGQPVRHGEPVVDGAVDGNFQPYVSVVRDGETGRWRMWYNVPKTAGDWGASSLAMLESEDGVRWLRPHRVLETPPIQFGASVIDEGPAFPDPPGRFKAAWHHNNGLQVAVSPDGVTWRELAPGPVLRHNHDIDAIDWDPIRKRYMAFVSVAATLDPAWKEPRRIPHMSTSDDLIHWRAPWPVVVPDVTSPREQGETQFYCMAGVVARGGLLVGLVKVLRDDLNAEPGLTAQDLGDTRPHAGIGYTVLAWSADGENWRRDTEPFLDRNPVPGTWDRAHAWADEQVVHGEEVYLYYGGYRLGHKGERFTTRQIGLARLKRDRYAGFAASAGRAGTLGAPPRVWEAGGLTMNADVRGELRVALCEPSGRFIPGFSFDDALPLRGDAVAHAVRWRTADPAALRGRVVQPVFRWSDGTVFSFSTLP